MSEAPAPDTTPADCTGYFLYHSIGQYPGKAADLAGATAEFAGVWGTCDDAQWGHLLGRRAAFIDRWRTLIGAREGSVTTCENVTAGVYSIMGALPRERLRGRRVLVAGDCFPSLHFLLTGLAPRLGFTLDTVPLRAGADWVEDDDIIAQWGDDVGVALLTWVSSTSSHRSDIARLAAHGREMGSLVGADITQAAGLLPFDVAGTGVDFTVSTSLKWMCGTPGAGIIHVDEALIPQCHPEFRGWFSQDNPFSWDFDAFAFAPDIRRFDNGTPAALAAIASLPAMEWHAAQDHAAMRAHNRRLCARIIEGAEALGHHLVSPRDPDLRGGSVMLRLPDSLPAGEVLGRLRGAGVFADARDNLLRFSPGAVTTDAGVDRLLEALPSA
ncbi:aminotransferase [Rhodobacteraceae bacterium WD3A24]|nr:aminotransferase [Rhodobacteraceae bacterium WD3A24]